MAWSSSHCRTTQSCAWHPTLYSSLIGGQARGTFHTETPSAVAGVRGTAYNLKVAADQSTDISVYEGEVCVQPPLIVKGGPKEEIEWPGEVSEKRWEETILGQFQRLHIGPVLFAFA